MDPVNYPSFFLRAYAHVCRIVGRIYPLFFAASGIVATGKVVSRDLIDPAGYILLTPAI